MIDPSHYTSLFLISLAGTLITGLTIIVMVPRLKRQDLRAFRWVLFLITVGAFASSLFMTTYYGDLLISGPPSFAPGILVAYQNRTGFLLLALAWFLIQTDLFRSKPKR